MPQTKAITMAALGLLVLFVAWGLWKPTGIALDFANFYDAGQKALEGQFADLYDPNALIGGREPVGHMSFYSAPLTSLLYAPMAALPPHAALFLFKLAGTVAQVAALLLIWRFLLPLADGADRARYTAAFAVAVLVFQPFWTIYRVGGQTTPFVLLALVLGMIWTVRGRPVAAALALALAVLVKPVLAPGAVLIFLLSGKSFRLTALAAGLGTAALSLALFGMDLHHQFLTLLGSETKKLLDPTLNSAPFSFLTPWMAPLDQILASGPIPPALRWVTLALSLITALGLLAGLRAVLRADLRPAARSFAIWGAAILISLILSPVVWAHYPALIFPLLAALLALKRHLTPGPRFLLAATFLLALFQHRLVVQKLQAVLGGETFVALATIGLMKSLLLLTVLALMFLGRRTLLAALRDPAWARVS